MHNFPFLPTMAITPIEISSISSGLLFLHSRKSTVSSVSKYLQQLSHKCSDSLFLFCYSPSRKPIAVCVLAKSPQWCLFAIPGTVAHQAPLSMGLFRQEYWSGLPCPPPGDLPNPGIKPASLMSPELSDRFFTICCVRLQISLLKFLRVYAQY